MEQVEDVIQLKLAGPAAGSETTPGSAASLGVFAHLPDALLLVDPHTGRVVDANPAALGHLGAVVGRAFGDLTGRGAAVEGPRLARVAERGTTRFVASLRTPSGTWPSRLRASTLPGPAGPLVLLTIRDAQGMLRRAEGRERRAPLDTQGAGIRRLHHDLGNALTASGANVDVARDLVAAGDVAALDEVLGDVRAALRNADALLRRLVDGAPARRAPAGAVCLSALVPRVVGLHLRGSPVRARVDADPGLPRVRGDAEELHRVFANLVRNARQALPAGGSLGVRLVAAPGIDGRAGVRVDLRDDGPGVPHALAAVLFRAGVSGRSGGQGLGLASCREVLRAAGGTIELERAGGPGACFRVWLPVHAEGAARLG